MLSRDYGALLADPKSSSDALRNARLAVEDAVKDTNTLLSDIRAIARAFAKRSGPINSPRLRDVLTQEKPKSSSFFTRALPFDDKVANWIETLRSTFASLGNAIDYMKETRHTTYVMLCNIMELYTLFLAPDPKVVPFQIIGSFGRDFDSPDTFAEDIAKIREKRPRSTMVELRTNSENPYVNIRYTPGVERGGITRAEIQRVAIAHLGKRSPLEGEELRKMQSMLNFYSEDVSRLLSFTRQWIHWRDRHVTLSMLRYDPEPIVAAAVDNYIEAGGSYDDEMTFVDKLFEWSYDTKLLDRQIKQAEFNMDYFRAYLVKLIQGRSLPPAKRARPFSMRQVDELKARRASGQLLPWESLPPSPTSTGTPYASPESASTGTPYTSPRELGIDWRSEVPELPIPADAPRFYVPPTRELVRALERRPLSYGMYRTRRAPKSGK